MSLFLSTYINKIDKKGRVSVPASFRAVLSGQSFMGIIAYASFLHPCIEACGMSRIEHLYNSIDLLDPYSDERDAFATTILGGSTQLSFDSEGRIVLPVELMQQAQLTDQVAFVGKGATFEMWAPEAFDAYVKKARTLAQEKRSALRLQQREGGQA